MTHTNGIRKKDLQLAIESESQKFKTYYLWLEKAMPTSFFEEISNENIMLVTHNLMGLDLQAYFSTIHLKNAAIVMCLESADADLCILKNYAFYGIKNYQAFVSTLPLPFPELNNAFLRIAVISFTGIDETETPLPNDIITELLAMAKTRNKTLTEDNFNKLISGLNSRFLRSQPIDHLITVLEMFSRAQTRDNCQYEVRYNEHWQDNKQASIEIFLAWKNTPKHNFLYRMARVIQRHHLIMQRVNATYINAYEKESVFVMVLDLHGSNGQAAWDAANIPEFLRELMTVKYFSSFDKIDHLLVSKNLISGTLGNFIRSMINFIHQSLVHLDANLYTIDHIQEAFCRHPELTSELCEAFQKKHDPETCDYKEYLKLREQFLTNVGRLDTGQEDNDTRRKVVLRQGMNFIHHILKTNFYRTRLTAHSFRMDPKYLDNIPFDREKLFPELPYAIFFVKGMHFFGFHIRFKDLSRGGLRTVFPTNPEQIVHERNNIFTECYNLSLTQHLKNKDIPEGGSKGIIFVNPIEQLESETLIFQKELEISAVILEDLDKRLEVFRNEQRIEYLHQAQRSFIESLLVLVNCESDGSIRAKHIVDYWKRPEYLYLGPDENMHDEMIQWIADLSVKYKYKPGGAFISSKPRAGINHKAYGVTSLGINVYLEALLKFIGIDPNKSEFSIKMSGGPDGDVAGNQIYNLWDRYPKTARLLTLVDVSGTIYDPNGLRLDVLVDLFHQGKPIKYYPPEMLSVGGFLLDKNAKRTQTALTQQTLCWRKKENKVEEDWVSGSEMNHILRNTINQVKTDIFIPAGGRPRTLNEENFKDFLDEGGKPTARGIIEGANLYLTPKGRRALEKLGVLIIKDSSANKTGVICSSFEVLCGLAITDLQFVENKESLVREILDRLRQCAASEVELLLRTHKTTHEFLTDISQHISERINQYTYQLLDYLDFIPWDNNLNNPMTRCFLSYCPPTLNKKFQTELLNEIPEHHKKAIVACHLSAHVVYKKGLNWQPSIVDIFPLLLQEEILNSAL